MKKNIEKEYEKFLEELQTEPQSVVDRFSPEVNWKHWLLRDEWKLDEAIFLSLGIDPYNLPVSNNSKNEKSFFEFIEEKASRSLIARSSIEALTLKVRQSVRYDTPYGTIRNHHVEPKEFVRWLKQKNFVIPEQLKLHGENKSDNKDYNKINTSVKNIKDDGRTVGKLNRQIDILKKALSLIKNNNEACKDNIKKISGAGIYRLMKKNEKIIWPSSQSPLLSKDKTERLLNECLKKVPHLVPLFFYSFIF